MSGVLFIMAEEVVKNWGVSKPFVYKLIRQLNEEFEKRGFMNISERVSRRYYEEKLYGISREM